MRLQPSGHSFQLAALNLTESLPSIISICTVSISYRAYGLYLPLANFKNLLNKDYVLTWLPQSAGKLSTMERFAAKCAGAGIMYIISKKLKKKYNITDERAALYEAAETWTRALKRERIFSEDPKPNLADLAVFGVLRPVRYLKAGRGMVENTQIGEWYQWMETAVGMPSRINS